MFDQFAHAGHDHTESIETTTSVPTPVREDSMIPIFVFGGIMLVFVLLIFIFVTKANKDQAKKSHNTQE